MIRNIMGCLLRMVGYGHPAARLGVSSCWHARDRDAAAPTFSPDGLYFPGSAVYDTRWSLPERTAAYDWLP
jgi:tRNA pseudouridine38-40 synthase